MVNDKTSQKTKTSFYVTTTLPYVNSDPHIGFALEIVRADALVRYKALLGHDVFFNTGTDEHGAKIYQKAKERGVEPQVYADEYSKKFQALKDLLELSPNLNFIRTTDLRHKKSAQDFWRKCLSNGDIYKKKYKGLYCVGEEMFVTKKDLLENGKCPNHDEFPVEIEEENYFFRFSKYQNELLKLYEERPDFVIPDFRQNEIRKFVERGLEDFSVSRLKEKMPWGVPVPDDDNHVMYVWFDALVNYISAIGWPEDMETFEHYWPVVQYAGKDNLRQQAAMWQAMLMSAGLPPSRNVIINGFITSGGKKMSKSLGNVISPSDIVSEYSADALRYFLLRELQPFDDGDFTMDRFKEVYNANLANGLGNLVSRILKMAAKYKVEVEVPSDVEILQSQESAELHEHIANFDHARAMDFIFREIGELDKYIQETEPFKLIKKDEVQAREVVAYLIIRLNDIACYLIPFMPASAAKIREYILKKTIPPPLFQRKI